MVGVEVGGDGFRTNRWSNFTRILIARDVLQRFVFSLK